MLIAGNALIGQGTERRKLTIAPRRRFKPITADANKQGLGLIVPSAQVINV